LEGQVDIRRDPSYPSTKSSIVVLPNNERFVKRGLRFCDAISDRKIRVIPTKDAPFHLTTFRFCLFHGVHTFLLDISKRQKNIPLRP